MFVLRTVLFCLLAYTHSANSLADEFASVDLGDTVFLELPEKFVNANESIPPWATLDDKSPVCLKCLVTGKKDGRIELQHKMQNNSPFSIAKVTIDETSVTVNQSLIELPRKIVLADFSVPRPIGETRFVHSVTYRASLPEDSTMSLAFRRAIIEAQEVKRKANQNAS